MIGYVLDDAAVMAGLATGAESQRREFSRLLHDAYDGGPRLHMPTLCLVSVATDRPSVAEHVAILVTEATGGGLDIPGLAAGQLNQLVAEFPGLGMPAAHAAAEAIAREATLITTDPDRYRDVAVQAIAL